jgi:hypothetical protein
VDNVRLWALSVLEGNELGCVVFEKSVLLEPWEPDEALGERDTKPLLSSNTFSRNSSLGLSGDFEHRFV